MTPTRHIFIYLIKVELPFSLTLPVRLHVETNDKWNNATCLSMNALTVSVSFLFKGIPASLAVLNMIFPTALIPGQIWCDRDLWSSKPRQKIGDHKIPAALRESKRDSSSFCLTGLLSVWLSVRMLVTLDLGPVFICLLVHLLIRLYHNSMFFT